MNEEKFYTLQSDHSYLREYDQKIVYFESKADMIEHFENKLKVLAPSDTRVLKKKSYGWKYL